MPIQPKSKAQSPDAPSVVRATSLDRSAHRSFLADVVIDHGPRDILGRLFLLADTRLREKGVFLSFASFDELLAVNRANSESWRPLLPIFDPTMVGISSENGFAVVARDTNGRAIYAAASRLYDLTGTSLKDEIESLRIFYNEPGSAALPGETMQASAPIASKTRSVNVVFTGAQWVHPDHRHSNFTQATLPITRALSLTRWWPDLTFSFMAPEIVKAGVAWRGYMNVDWEVTMTNTPVLRNETINAGLIWTNRDLQLLHFSDYLEPGSVSSNRRRPRIGWPRFTAWGEQKSLKLRTSRGSTAPAPAPRQWWCQAGASLA